MSHEIMNKINFLSGLQYVIIDAIMKVFILTYFHKSICHKLKLQLSSSVDFAAVGESDGT